MFWVKVVALIFGSEVSRDPEGPGQRQEPGAASAQGQARGVGCEWDTRGVVRQVLELLLLWPQGKEGKGRGGGRRMGREDRRCHIREVGVVRKKQGESG